jgi:hypothetical protein
MQGLGVRFGRKPKPTDYQRQLAVFKLITGSHSVGAGTDRSALRPSKSDRRTHSSPILVEQIGRAAVKH